MTCKPGLSAFRIVALAWLVAFAPGCSTTGDPTEGGLFGWSEGKALNRQLDLRERADAAAAVVDDVRARKARLESSHADESRAVSRLEQTLADLRLENRKLRAQFADLAGSEQELSAELRALEGKLAQTEAAIVEKRERPKRELQSRVDALADENERLHQAILFLLE